MIKALSTLGDVDLLIGSTPDDFGAAVVFSYLRGTIINEIWVDQVPPGHRKGYDVAIMAIPFDGRWKNGQHYEAKRVLDERKRPGNVERLGFDMWKKHEVEYQMENARELGYDGPTPSACFLPAAAQDPNLVYVGVGYKRDPGGFGSSKHFGNERYAKLIREVHRLRPGTKFLSTGGPMDLVQVGYQIIKALGNDSPYRFPPIADLKVSFRELTGCAAYIGNDTGMMHVAASTGMPTCGLFAYPGLTIKNPPFCDRSLSIAFDKDSPSVEHIAEQFVDFVWGKG